MPRAILHVPSRGGCCKSSSSMLITWDLEIFVTQSSLGCTRLLNSYKKLVLSVAQALSSLCLCFIQRFVHESVYILHPQEK